MRSARFGEDHEAADVVGRELLQAQAEPDADRAAQHRQRGEVDAHRRQRQQQADEDQHRAHEVGRGLAPRQPLAGRALEHLRLDRRRDPQRHHQHDAGDDRSPSRIVARLIVPDPIFQCTSSSASMNDGSTPVIHSTTPPHASHDTVFSTARTTPGLGERHAHHAHRQPDQQQRQQDRHHHLEDGQRQVVAHAEHARHPHQGQPQRREQHAVEDVAAEDDGADARHRAAQQARDGPGDGERGGDHQQRDIGVRLLGLADQRDEFG